MKRELVIRIEKHGDVVGRGVWVFCREEEAEGTIALAGNLDRWKVIPAGSRTKTETADGIEKRRLELTTHLGPIIVDKVSILDKTTPFDFSNPIRQRGEYLFIGVVPFQEGDDWSDLFPTAIYVAGQYINQELLLALKSKILPEFRFTVEVPD